MFRMTLAGLVVASAAAASAQDRAFSQPYWTERPVIEAIGRVELEVPPNRAAFDVTFIETEPTADEAAANAAEAARQAEQAIRVRVGTGSVRMSSNLSIETLYEQYRDRDGNRVDNERADRITGYSAEVTLSVDVLELAKAADARAAALAARPQNVGELSYSLFADPEMQRNAYRLAVEDAAAKARIAATATGARLGRLMTLQNGQGPCLGQWYAVQTGVVAIDRRGDGPAQTQNSVSPITTVRRGGDEEIVVTGSRIRPAITVSDIQNLTLPSEPQPIRLSAVVCTIYAVEP